MAMPVSGYLATILVITAVMITVIGPVGSEIKLLEPPNNAAYRPTMIAPHKPASAPAPEATPNANAKGSEMMAVVTPPNISPLRLISVKRLPNKTHLPDDEMTNLITLTNVSSVQKVLIQSHNSCLITGT